MVTSGRLKAIEDVVLRFPWHDYGLDSVSDATEDPDPSCREWARALAVRIVEVLDRGVVGQLE